MNPPLKPEFELTGTVGRIWNVPHDRAVGDASVVVLHMQAQSQNMMSPWYVLFHKHQLKDLKTGDVVRVLGCLERVSDQLEQRFFGKLNAHIKPMGIYLWGHSWQIQSKK